MLSFADAVKFAAAITLVCVGYVGVWRLIWSPLSKFPGPKLAALTLWYEFYFDVVRGGMYIWEIERLHKIYGIGRVSCYESSEAKSKAGPIIRISPHELHVNDPQCYDDIYASSHRARDKYTWQVKSGDSAQAMGFTVSHGLHRKRRQAVDHFFSTQSVAKLEDSIHQKIEKLCGRIEQYKKAQKPINLTDAYLALTMDIVESYSFGVSSNLLEHPTFSSEWGTTITGIMSKTALLNHCGWIPKLIKLMPRRLVETIEPSLAMMNDLKEVSSLATHPLGIVSYVFTARFATHQRGHRAACSWRQGSIPHDLRQHNGRRRASCPGNDCSSINGRGNYSDYCSL
jgi:hypothetical protein